MFLLSFDIEEFDMPFEYGKTISFEEQIEVSARGTTLILDLLKKHNFKATFFSTVVFAEQVPKIIERIKDEGHELASHSYFHSKFDPSHLRLSREKLEALSGMPVLGFRMPRMMPVDEREIQKAGYSYNSSINPTWLPGRYNNLHVPRTFFKKDGLLQLPASVSPLARIPLFWLSFHNFPLWFYKLLIKRTLKKDGYVNIYFHPWEFTDLNQKEKYGFPSYVSKNSGAEMINRIDHLLSWINKRKYLNRTIYTFLENII